MPFVGGDGVSAHVDGDEAARPGRVADVDFRFAVLKLALIFVISAIRAAPPVFIFNVAVALSPLAALDLRRLRRLRLLLPTSMIVLLGIGLRAAAALLLPAIAIPVSLASTLRKANPWYGQHRDQHTTEDVKP